MLKQSEPNLKTKQTRGVGNDVASKTPFTRRSWHLVRQNTFQCDIRLPGRESVHPLINVFTVTVGNC